MQQVMHLCDRCFLNGVEAHASEVGVQFGINRNVMVADLCDAHKQELDLSLDVFFMVGRRPDAVVKPVPVTKKAQKKGGTPTPSQAGDFRCPVIGCEGTFTTNQGVSMHKTRVHRIPGVQRAGQEAHDLAVANASPHDVAEGTITSGVGAHFHRKAQSSAGDSAPQNEGQFWQGRSATRTRPYLLTPEQRERKRQRDRDRYREKRQGLR